MPRRKSTRGRRKKGGIPQSSRAFEARLARSTDASVLCGKFLTSATSITTTPSSFFSLSPANLGVRAVALSAIFARYRFKYVRFKFSGTITVATAPTLVPGILVLAVLDDSSTAEGDAPTTATALTELRCSGTNFAIQTVPTEFVWQPVDKTKWYYTYNGASGSDVRLVAPGVLYTASTVAAGSGVATSIDVEIDYELVFSGAVDIGSA